MYVEDEEYPSPITSLGLGEDRGAILMEYVRGSVLFSEYAEGSKKKLVISEAFAKVTPAQTISLFF